MIEVQSHDTWAKNSYLKQIANSDWQDNINPRYVEVSFPNVCNLKCSHCSPAFSSKWAEEIPKVWSISQLAINLIILIGF